MSGTGVGRESAPSPRPVVKEAVDVLLRRGLAAQDSAVPAGQPYRVDTFRSEFRPGVDVARMNQLVDDLEARRISGARP